MKAIILYMSSHGCTEKTANAIKSHLSDFETELINLKNKKVPDISKYDLVIIGGSIHAGNIQQKIKKYCNNNSELLAQKKIALFLCCMYEGEVAQQQFENVYSAELRKVAVATAIVGGEFNFEKMNFFEKMIVKKVAKVDKSVSTLNHESIKGFTKKLILA